MTALLCDPALNRPLKIPDPCSGGVEGFDDVYRMIRAASEALSKAL